MKAEARLLPSRDPLGSRTPRDRLVVALDVPTLEGAQDLLRRLIPAVHWFKIGPTLFTSAGPAAVALVLERGGRVFLDLKFHDIPHTVRGAVRAAMRLGVSMVNVHAEGGDEMMRAAAEARGDAAAYVIGVTALTSAEMDLPRIVEMARAARAAGLDGVVASPQEAAPIKAACGASFVVVTPGIRPAPVPSDDQRRTATPAAAVSAGSDFLVVGRPILGASDPLRAAEEILDEIARADAPEGRKTER